MGIVEAAREVLWARRNSPDQPVYGIAMAHERSCMTWIVIQARD